LPLSKSSENSTGQPYFRFVLRMIALLTTFHLVR
jgi:hypothetical protein